jgi:hypothetical protein
MPGGLKLNLKASLRIYVAQERCWTNAAEFSHSTIGSLAS